MIDLLHSIWDAEIETMDVIFDICNKLNLRCYLAYGTLIGAVRHHGFIPWDDDVDLVMPRSDYDVFLNEAEKYFPKNMRLNHYQKTDEKAASSTLKVENTDCQILRTYGSVEKWTYAWVDIWPTDAVPDGTIPFLMFKIGTMVRLCLCRLCDIEVKGVNAEEKPLIEDMIINVNKVLRLGKRMSRSKRYQKLESYFRKRRYDKCKRTVMIMGDERFEATVPTSYYGEAVMLDFAGKKYPAPAQYDLLLKQIFGDYMQFPPKEKQVCRHVIDVKKVGDKS